ncbi:MAG: phosphate ABC transporter substrate-binding protein [Planctomycetes bacterium]|nr:phosphate ABC transporter substrate-binding protein [Planctomycetota bacterium]MCB9909887.1 phosphate ABC transporter substrate-binding protein [Planctomycetota bacterium]MCB9913373.1 phosphate ABC transporter substrate-binding protein [Planctomycetota bacterium]HPF13055.1 phosphate ABC transporter substrate-binding protein [Planctomycetota bacterium]HRV79902.1 phosphate ABC transporter substrate-binding protein [Planctomycetota bacterium]
MDLSKLLGISLLGSTLLLPLASAQVKVDKKLPDYKPTEGVTGNINSIGSDTMNNLMALWAEGFKKHYSQVQVEITGKGSSTAPPALIKGQSTFGPMSRMMKSEEIDEFKKTFGYEPTALPTSIDMLAVYVHKDNPIKGLTLQQVDAIFSKTRKGGLSSDIVTWGQLGLEGEWADKTISIYGRNSASGTYGYFKEHALFKGDYKDNVKEQPGSASVVQGVARDKYAIGYSGIGYKTADVRAVPLAKDAEGEAIAAEPENAYTGKYPMARFLYVYINKDPKKDLEPLRGEFLKYVYSKQGQQRVIEDGYFPITAKIAEKALKSVGIELPKVVEAGAAKE